MPHAFLYSSDCRDDSKLTADLTIVICEEIMNDSSDVSDFLLKKLDEVITDDLFQPL